MHQNIQVTPDHPSNTFHYEQTIPPLSPRYTDTGKYTKPSSHIPQACQEMKRCKGAMTTQRGNDKIRIAHTFLGSPLLELHSRPMNTQLSFHIHQRKQHPG